jgi:hypothetical protein
LALAFAAVVLDREFRHSSPPAPPAVPSPPPSAITGHAARPDARAILEAYRERVSNVWVEAGGVVEEVLPDDRMGSRHQRLVVRLEAGNELLVSHNIDLAPRVPAGPGDSIQFRGRYEWNERGGVVHWTHHDPDGRMPGGWIRIRGRTYR